MLHRLAAAIAALALSSISALCQPGPGGGGPGPVPDPWTVDGNSISYPGCVLLPAGVAGGCKGDGSINATLLYGGSLLVSGNAIISGHNSLGFIDAGVWNATPIDLTTKASGTLQAAQFPGLTGVVTSTGFATTIPNGNITAAMLAGSIPSSKLIGSDIATVGTLTAGQTGAGFNINLTTSTVTGPLNGVQVTGLPTCVASGDACPKSYIDTLSGGIKPIGPSALATAAILPNSPTYSNGTAGVGAKIESSTNTTPTIDGTIATIGQVVIVKNEGDMSGLGSFANGQYYVSQAGSGAAHWILTRCASGAGQCSQEFDSAATMLQASYTVATAGATNVGNSYTLQGTVTTPGTTPVVWLLYQPATNGVASIQSMVGAIGCGSTMSCTGGSIGVANGGITNTQIASATINLTSKVTGILPPANGGSGTSTIFTAGSVVFAGASGVYQQDNNFVWDNASKRLGIQTGAPVTALEVDGPPDNSNGLIRILSAGNNAGLTLWTSGVPSMRNWQISSNYQTAGGLSFMRSATNTGNPTVPILEIDSNGDFGFGTTAPTAQIDATGSVRLRAISSGCVTADGSGFLSAVACVSSTFPVSIQGQGGIDCAGSADSTAGLVALYSSNATLLVPPGCTVRLSGTPVANGKTLVVPCGALVTVSAAATATFLGLIPDPGACQIFTGSCTSGSWPSGSGCGAVLGIASVRCDWWGCNSALGDNSPQIKAAIASVQASSTSDALERAMNFGCWVHAIGSTLTFTPTPSINWRLYGCGTVGGTTILANASFSGPYAVNLAGSSTSGNSGITDFLVKGITIINQTAGSGPSYGLSLGSGGANQLTNFIHSKVEDIWITGFAVDLQQINARLISYYRVAGWCSDASSVPVSGCTPILITSDGGSPTTDSEFLDSECAGMTSGSITGTCVDITDLGNPNSHVSGIKFTNFTFYGSAIQLALNMTGAGSVIDDIWENPGTQHEGLGTNIMTNLFASGVSTRVTNVHLSHIYGRGSGFSTHINGSVSGGGEISDIFVDNAALANAGNEFIRLSGVGGTCNGINLTGNQFRSPTTTGGAVGYFEACSDITANGNSVKGTGTRANFFTFNVSGDYFTAVGNNSGGQVTSTLMNNAAGAAHTQFSANQ